MYDIVIVGAGTAGMTAALYARRAGKRVLLLEAKQYGGQIVESPEVENYPGIPHISGYDFAESLHEQIVALGVELRGEAVTGVENASDEKLVRTAQGCYRGRAVILATGAKNRPLGVDREQELTGAGVSYCATCDGAFFRGKTTAVVGGGNTALEDAEVLAGLCRQVYVIHRRAALRGEQALEHALRAKDNVTFLLECVVTALHGASALEAITVRQGDGTERMLAVEGLFVAVGQIPQNGAFADVVPLDDGGYIRAGEDCRTGTAGIFAAGDCRTKPVRQLATAAADGAAAALAACADLAK